MGSRLKYKLCWAFHIYNYIGSGATSMGVVECSGRYILCNHKKVTVLVGDEAVLRLLVIVRFGLRWIVPCHSRRALYLARIRHDYSSFIVTSVVSIVMCAECSYLLGIPRIRVIPTLGLLRSVRVEVSRKRLNIGHSSQ